MSTSSRDILRCLRAMHAGNPIAVADKMNFLNMYFVVVTMAGIVIEYEVKVSREDFHRDKRKHRHKIYSKEIPGVLPNRFYYATAQDIVTNDDIPQWAGWYEHDGAALMLKKRAPAMHAEKHPTAILMRLARAMRKRRADA